MSSGIYNHHTGYHNRQSIRLRGYDYSRPGFYFVTVCIHDRKHRVLGDVVDGVMVPNPINGIVRFCWDDLESHYPHIKLDEFIIMPNHVHGIIMIRDSMSLVGAGLKPAPTDEPKPAPTGEPQPPIIRHGLPEIVRAFKTFSSRRINQTGQPFKWQRNYYDHIIRNETSLFFIRKYIRNNPLAWEHDPENHIDTELEHFKTIDPQ